MRRIGTLIQLGIVIFIGCLFSSCGSENKELYTYTITYLNSQATGIVEDEYETECARDQTGVLLEELPGTMKKAVWRRFYPELRLWRHSVKWRGLIM